MRWSLGIVVFGLLSGCAGSESAGTASQVWTLGDGAQLIYEFHGDLPLRGPVAPALTAATPRTVRLDLVEDGSRSNSSLVRHERTLRIDIDDGREGSLWIAGQAPVIIQTTLPEGLGTRPSTIVRDGDPWCFGGSWFAQVPVGTTAVEVTAPDGPPLAFALTWAGDRYLAEESSKATHPLRLEGTAASPCPTFASGRSRAWDPTDTRTFEARLIAARSGSGSVSLGVVSPGPSVPESARIAYGAPVGTSASVPFPLADAVDAATANEQVSQFLRSHPRAVLIEAANSTFGDATWTWMVWKLIFAQEEDMITVTATRSSQAGLLPLTPPTISLRDGATPSPPFTFPRDGLDPTARDLYSMAELHAGWFGKVERMVYGILPDGTRIVRVEGEGCASCPNRGSAWDADQGGLLTYPAERAV